MRFFDRSHFQQFLLRTAVQKLLHLGFLSNYTICWLLTKIIKNSHMSCSLLRKQQRYFDQSTVYYGDRPKIIDIYTCEWQGAVMTIWNPAVGAGSDCFLLERLPYSSRSWYPTFNGSTLRTCTYVSSERNSRLIVLILPLNIIATIMLGAREVNLLAVFFFFIWKHSHKVIYGYPA